MQFLNEGKYEDAVDAARIRRRSIDKMKQCMQSYTTNKKARHGGESKF